LYILNRTSPLEVVVGRNNFYFVTGYIPIKITVLTENMTEKAYSLENTGIPNAFITHHTT
jgi:hypothetical protein